jgi:AraC-like DNA-binding protein
MSLKSGNPLTLYFCGYEKCTPSHSFGPAVRPHYLIHYILNGQGCYYENGREHHLSTGDGFLITPGKTTYYIADTQNPWEYCWIGFDGYDVKTILDNCGFSEANLIFHMDEIEFRTNLLDLNQTFNTNTGNSYYYVSSLYKFFSYLIPTAKDNTSFATADYVEQAITYINHNYIYDIKITDVANSIGLDRTYLYKLFMSSKKVSPQQYLIEYRLQTACIHLKETNLAVTEIAYSCGFKDSPSFNKHFKKHYNMTPLQYRKLMKWEQKGSVAF